MGSSLGCDPGSPETKGLPDLFQRTLSTESVEEARKSMSELYDAPMVLSTQTTEQFRYGMSAVGDAHMTLAHLHYSGACRSGAPAFSTFVMTHAIGGQHRWSVGRESGAGGVPFLVAPQLPMRYEFDALDLVTVSIGVPTVEAWVRAVTGGDAARLAVDRPNTRSRDPAFVASTLGYLDRALRADPDSFAHPILRAEATRLAVAAMVTTFPIVHLEAQGTAEGKQATGTLRRAMAFMDDNADRPVTVNDVAAAVHVSVRGLQLAFQRHSGITPMQYLRRVRLDAAHRELLRAEPGNCDTVEIVAKRWGFAHLPRFASIYRQTYGEYPSQTLRR